MILKQRIKTHEIRCFNIVTNPRDSRYGLECTRLLICVNSDGDAAGSIKCPRCGALYEMKNGYIYLKTLKKYKERV